MCFDVDAPDRTRSDSLNIDLSDDETDAPAATDGTTGEAPAPPLDPSSSRQGGHRCGSPLALL